VERPIRWARNGDASIAFRTLGEGPLDIVFVSGLVSHLEVLLEEPGVERWFTRMGRLGRVVLFDPRGSGLSDPLPDGFTLEDAMADLEAVLDAVGADRVVLNAYAGGGPTAVAFAALRPERSLALVLYAAMAQFVADDDVPWALAPQEREQRLLEARELWGTGRQLELLAPSLREDERVRAWLGKLERLSCTPSGLERLSRFNATVDVKPLLDRIRVPTLVLHRTQDQNIDVRHSRFLADRIAGARLVELPGEDSLPMAGDAQALLAEITEFLTGGKGAREPERALRTVLFTDVVGATGHAARLGDGRWRDLLAEHDKRVRAQLRAYAGEEVKTVGDGFLATFAGPPSGALRCARAIVEAVADLGLEVRAGLHTGECEVIGADVGGMAVHIAARISALAAAGEVLASGTVFGTVVGSGLQFEDRGSSELRGVPGRWPVFALA
jgi:class 3 adenylate cyclase